MTAEQITEAFSDALKNHEFIVYYQPQYNHSTGMMVGAEALARWNRPGVGLISPGEFIPVLEASGQITELDYSIFGDTCAFIKKCMTNGLHMIPISTNFSRYDIFKEDFIDRMETIRKQHDVPAKYLRVEITESVAMQRETEMNEIISKLNACGYLVEMDDFGSGYSSLNVLKDIPFDIIKLDMKFLTSITQNNRAGIILSSVVKMAQWLGVPIIAEGVETKEQSNFLKSIGCEYIQGYLYSKPLPEADFYLLMSGAQFGKTASDMELIDTLDACTFWTPESLDTLIFSNYVGAAVVFEYKDGAIHITRVNQKYLKELGMNMSEKEVIQCNILDQMDEENKALYLQTIEKAIASEDEEECETWRTITSGCCGEEHLYIRSSIRMIGKSKSEYLFYAMIRNITKEAARMETILASEKRFKAASEQANIYYWEYTVATHEMRPCFRCMRDLGLPAVLTNYPDSAIEVGVFPPEVADMYRDWHKQIDAGKADHLEAVIPLTADRIPFHVRYTTEFDEVGHPIKAYGSATLVVD